MSTKPVTRRRAVRDDCGGSAADGRFPLRNGVGAWGLPSADRVMDVKNAAIMGDGVIDGRGYAKILGKDYSWWEMARKAEPKNERYLRRE